MNPRISVVMPVYNREAYVAEAIRSVLSQTFTDWELLIVDDGSTDSTAEVIRTFADARVRYIRQQHRGISAAMNTGLALARGAYVARLDSDDVWLPEMLSTQVVILDTRPEVGAVYARAQGMERDGTPVPDFRGTAQRYPGDSFLSMLNRDFTCNITVVARRECFEVAGRYDESLRTNEDWDLWLRVARHFPFAFNERIVARYRWHEGSITSPTSPYFRETRERRIEVLHKAFREPDLPPRATSLKWSAYRNLHIDEVLMWSGAGEYRPAVRSFWRAVRAGGNPLSTTGRVTWLLFTRSYLGHREWGRLFVDWTSQIRRRWRERQLR